MDPRKEGNHLLNVHLFLESITTGPAPGDEGAFNWKEEEVIK